MTILCDEDFLGKLIINLHGLSNGNENLQNTLPPPKRGRKEVKLEGGITHKLLYIYTEGTGLEAKCYWHPIYDRSTGEFYHFLLKAIDLVKKYTPIKNIDNETWAKHAQEVIKYHYRKSKHLE